MPLKIIKYLLISVAIILITVCFLYWRGITTPAGSLGRDTQFIIGKGQSVNQISQNLYDAGLIKSKFNFEAYAWLTKQETKIKSGEYNLSPNLTIREIVKILAAGEALSKERKITIVEGWNINDINKYLQDNTIVLANQFSDIAKSRIKNQELRIKNPEFLGDAPPSANLEGYLFPDTYRIFKDAAAEDIVKKMLINFNDKLTDEMRNEIARQGRTIYEIVTMASIIEKEVRTPEDIKIVSGIFWDRIKYGQSLESCATLAYILGVNKEQYSIEDTKIDSPYNTYRNPGLPPGPICNPGLNAINAAIYPQYTEYNYFLNRQDTGETIFSKTLDEHNRNKAKYLK
ncbi:MAG: endolytic transglycosylase MltG [bacterium]|nr:endolytic transglycosylase MltG [bacterium]